MVQPYGEILAIHEGHDEEDQSLAFVDAVDRDDVWMAELRSGLCFLQKARADLRAKRELRRQQLDGDRALQAFVARLVDDAHSPASDFAIELVMRAQNALDVRAQLLVCRGCEWFGHSGNGDGERARVSSVHQLSLIHIS